MPGSDPNESRGEGPVAAKVGTKTPEKASWERLVVLPMLGACVFHLLVLLVLPPLRAGYPTELELNEGLTVDFAWRIAHGLRIYGPASATFAPNYYPPGHYLLALPLLALSRWQLWAPRLLSWLSMLAAMFAGDRALRGQGAPAAARVFALGVVAHFYPVSLYWYDLTRVDAPAAGLAVVGAAVVCGPRAAPSDRRIAVGALLLALAVFTKQTSVFPCAAAVLFFALRRDGRRALKVAGALALFGLLGLAAVFAWQGRDAWLMYTMPQKHRLFVAIGLRDWWTFAWRMLPFAAVAVGGLVVARRREAAPEGAHTSAVAPVLGFFTLQFVATALAGGMTMLKVGGDVNSSIPAFVFLGIAAGLAAGPLWAWASARHALAPPRALATLSLAAVMLSNASLDYLDQIPSGGDKALCDELRADMARVDGPFLAWNHGFFAIQVRGETQPSADRLYDIAGGYNGGPTFRHPVLARYPRDFLAQVAQRRFRAIYTDGFPIANDPVEALIRARYRVDRVFGTGRLPPPGLARWMYALPRVRWVPADVPAAP